MTGDFDPGLLPPGLLEGYLRSAQGQIEHLAGLADRLAADGTDPEALDEFRRESHKIRVGRLRTSLARQGPASRLPDDAP